MSPATCFSYGTGLAATQAQTAPTVTTATLNIRFQLPSSLFQSQRQSGASGRNLSDAQHSPYAEQAAQHIDANVKEVVRVQYGLPAEELEALLKDGGAERKGQGEADAPGKRAGQTLHQEDAQYGKEQAVHEDMHPGGTEQSVEEPVGRGRGPDEPGYGREDAKCPEYKEQMPLHFSPFLPISPCRNYAEGRYTMELRGIDPGSTLQPRRVRSSALKIVARGMPHEDSLPRIRKGASQNGINHLPRKIPVAQTLCLPYQPRPS